MNRFLLTGSQRILFFLSLSLSLSKIKNLRSGIRCRHILTNLLYGILLFCVSCSRPNHYVSQKIYNRLLNMCQGTMNTDILVYYFDGDCSICLAKAKAVEQFATQNNIKPIFIAKTLNTQTLQFNLKKLKIESCVSVEQNREFEKDLPFLKVTEIYTDRATFDYDDKFK